MSYKYKVRIVFFFEISSDQSFRLRFQIIWVADLTVIFLSDKLFGLVKTYRRDLVDFWKLDFEDLKKIGVVLKRAIYFITCGGRQMYPTKLQEDYILRNIMDGKEMLPTGVNVPSYEQLSLFDDPRFSV